MKIIKTYYLKLESPMFSHLALYIYIYCRCTVGGVDFCVHYIYIYISIYAQAIVYICIYIQAVVYMGYHRSKNDLDI